MEVIRQTKLFSSSPQEQLQALGKTMFRQIMEFMCSSLLHVKWGHGAQKVFFPFS